MFVNFNKVFKKDPQKNIKVPSAMVDYLNEQLPKGVKYIVDDAGNCQIYSKGEPVNIGGFTFIPDNDQKKVLGDNYSYSDIVRYSYNSQKAIPLKLIKDGFIKINGEEFDINKLNYNPFNPSSFQFDKLYMYPPKFTEKFILNVGNGKYSVNLNVERVPNDSISVVSYESDVNRPLKFKYFVDEDNNTMSFTISYDLTKVSNIRDIVESTAIYNSYIEGNGLISGHPISPITNNPKPKKYDAKSLRFWEKVLEIEELTDIHFIPPENDVDSQTIHCVETLYQNLVNKVPIRVDHKLSSIEGEWNMKSEIDVRNSIGEPIFFEFQATYEIELFGTIFNLPCLVGIFHSKLSDYSLNGNIYKFFLEDESEEKKMYISELRFLTEQDMKTYIETNGKDRISVLYNAQNVYFYESQ